MIYVDLDVEDNSDIFIEFIIVILRLFSNGSRWSAWPLCKVVRSLIMLNLVMFDACWIVILNTTEAVYLYN